MPYRFFTLLALAVLAIFIFWEGPAPAPLPALKAPLDKELLRIAHAGGEINGNIYTNSIEALDSNYDKGFVVFEIDLSWTEDNQLVCIHGWNKNFTDMFGLPPEQAPLTLEEFTSSPTKANLTPCTLESLAAWMREHPRSLVVTDVKPDEQHTNLDALAMIRDTVDDDIQDRILPQIYQPDEYKKARKLGYKHIIWTLYRYYPNAGADEVIAKLEDIKPFILTVPPEVISPELINYAKERDLPVYTHTVNDCPAAKRLEGEGIAGVYTDTLSPEACE